MSTEERFPMIVGADEMGKFYEIDGEKTHFSDDEFGALQMATKHAQRMADAFFDQCTLTLDSGAIPDFYRQDISPKAIEEVRKDLDQLKKHFHRAMFNLTLIFEF